MATRLVCFRPAHRTNWMPNARHSATYLFEKNLSLVFTNTNAQFPIVFNQEVANFITNERAAKQKCDSTRERLHNTARERERESLQMLSAIVWSMKTCAALSQTQPLMQDSKLVTLFKGLSAPNGVINKLKVWERTLSRYKNVKTKQMRASSCSIAKSLSIGNLGVRQEIAATVAIFGPLKRAR